MKPFVSWWGFFSFSFSFSPHILRKIHTLSSNRLRSVGGKKGQQELKPLMSASKEEEERAVKPQHFANPKKSLSQVKNFLPTWCQEQIWQSSEIFIYIKEMSHLTSLGNFSLREMRISVSPQTRMQEARRDRQKKKCEWREICFDRWRWQKPNINSFLKNMLKMLLCSSDLSIKWPHFFPTEDKAKCVRFIYKQEGPLGIRKF